jgi:bacterioferritin
MEPKYDRPEVLKRLDQILEAELSGVVRYLHYSFMIFGPNRIPITKWFRDQATEGFDHAVAVGEKITALGGHASVKVKPVPETNQHNVLAMLKESLEYERESLKLYYDLLPLVQEDVAFDELIRGLIRSETNHVEEVEKMIRTSAGSDKFHAESDLA